MTTTSDYPHIFRVRQRFDEHQIHDVAGEVDRQLSRLSLGSKIKPGQTVAVTAGSRGVSNIHLIIKAVVDHINGLGADPFIVPAMGSHGGGTAEGQGNVLASYGITQEFCGCPIRSSMETVIVCESAEGLPVHIDKHAYAADHVVLCNRIKPHTQFVGDIESGLMKIMLIGLGKYAGAKVYHRAIKDYSFAQIVCSVAAEVMARSSVVAGVGIVENSQGRTAIIEAIPTEQLEEREKELLTLAKKLMPRLPFRKADILLIDEMGKNISGTGFDVNVVGRKYIDHRPAEDEYPKIRVIGLRDITEESYGNAEGMGLAEFCRTRLVEKVDKDITYVNSLTGGHYTGSMQPLHFETDKEMLVGMLRQIGLTEPPDARLLWIRNTLTLTEVECGAAYLDEARERDDLEVFNEPRPLPLDMAGNLCDKHMDQ